MSVPWGSTWREYGSKGGRPTADTSPKARCEGCPLRCLCFKGQGNRIIEVNHTLNEYKRQAKERLLSEEGIRHRGQRCIEPEAVFGQMKHNMQYKRFRHFSKDKVTMDFALPAIAFNIKKMCSWIKKNGGNIPHLGTFAHACRIISQKNRLLDGKQSKLAA